MTLTDGTRLTPICRKCDAVATMFTLAADGRYAWVCERHLDFTINLPLPMLST